MDIKFDKETADGEETPANVPEKSRQTTQLLLLVLLLAVFGYVYFFTGLIRPQEPPPTPPQPVPQVVKQPLPSRDAMPGDAVKPVAAVKPNAVPVQPAPQSQAVAPGVKPVDSKPAKPVESAKPAVSVPAKPAVVAIPAGKKSEQPKQAAVVTPPVKGEQKAEASAAPVLKKGQSVPAKESQEKVAQSTKTVSNTKGPWTLVVNYYVVEEALAADLAKLKKVGFSPVVSSGPKRPSSMNRLFYLEAASKEEAQKAVEKLRSAAGDGFSVQRGTTYDVFAGSYAVLEGAKAEQQRLAASGVKVELRKVKVGIASRKLSVGTFTDRKSAEEALKKLKSTGVGNPVLE